MVVVGAGVVVVEVVVGVVVEVVVDVVVVLVVVDDVDGRVGGGVVTSGVIKVSIVPISYCIKQDSR